MPLRIESCPSQFQHQLKEWWNHWRESAGEEIAVNTDTLLEDASRQRAVARSFVGSDFFYRQCCHNPNLLPELLQSDDLGLEPIDIASLESEESLDRELRKLRNRVTAEVIYRDFAGQWDIPRVCQRLTELAEICIQAALAWHYRQLVIRYGEPRDRGGRVQSLIVLGMGKLGARELNLSSDIDLIFAYPEPGETDGENSVDNQKFFQRLGQRLIRSLDAITADGFVFRVDMRLRPYGDSGPLVSHFAALEDYYQTQGREWERYAMVKARPVAGDADVAAELMELLRPFTYRRYIDFSAIDALREMKTLIQRQVRARRSRRQCQTGPRRYPRGGIYRSGLPADPRRSRAGSARAQPAETPALAGERRPLGAGPRTTVGGCLSVVAPVEHALQAERDQQTQTLPAEEERRQKLAFALGRADWTQLQAELTAAREVIAGAFDAVIAPPEEIAPPSATEEWEGLWASCDSEAAAGAALQTLESTGLVPAQEALDLLVELKSSPAVATLPTAARERLDQSMPLLLAAASREERPLLALTRVLPLVRAVLRRSAYLVLINENPPVLKQLLRLCAASPWIAERLAKHPILLDELLDPRRLLAPATAADIADELRRELLRVDPSDLEVQMEALRHFKQSQSLRIGAQEVSGALPLMKVSDSLTWMAEAILQQSLQLAWTQLVEKHGSPAGASREDMRFAIVAYGKLGGLELGHGSDLDIVFVHDADPMQYTDGEAAIDNLRFYTRLAQRLIHILQTRTLSGPLYEVDTRLRPSGNSGLLVTSLTAFEKYQRESAWTWEHQALVRARPVAGSQRLCKGFEQLRLELLCQPRDEKKLREEVVSMRDKMRAHLDKSNDQSFDLKQGRGGIVDIEFMVQYAALAWAHTAPSIVRYTDNIRILESLIDTGLMPAHQAEHLIDAYKAYRSEGHRLALQQLPGVVSGDQFTAERKTVQTNWQQLLG